MKKEKTTTAKSRKNTSAKEKESLNSKKLIKVKVSELLAGNCPVGQELSPQSQHNRDVIAWNIRYLAEVRQWNKFKPLTTHPSNGDEEDYQTGAKPGFIDRYIASYTKGLPFSTTNPALADLGEVDKDAYCLLLKAIKSGDCQDFENVPLGSVDAAGNPICPPPNKSRNLENPQSALAYQLQGADSHDLFTSKLGSARIGFPPAPNFDSAEQISEIAENYWMALLRDVAFDKYDTNALAKAAADDLCLYQDFKGLKDSATGKVTPQTLFRGTLPGCDKGFYLSQFFLHDIPYGAQKLSGKVLRLPKNKDYMTYESNWLAVQRGCDFNQVCEDTPNFVFIRNGRDLAQFVHIDNAFYAPFNACLLLVSGANPLRRCEATPGLGAPFADGLPYMNPSADPVKFPRVPPFQSKNQIGMGTFGPNHLKSLLLEAMNLGLIAVWYQKWSVHRRLRPEAFAGRIHFNLSGNPLADYPFNPTEFAKLGSDAATNSLLDRVFKHNRMQNNDASVPTAEKGKGTYLLPMAFAEGSPLHPSYGQGHATAAGAGTTILKAFFKDVTFGELFAGSNDLNILRSNSNGVAVTDPNEAHLKNELTVHGELHKLAGNIAFGRDFGGVHYRSDATNSLFLGEQVAINLLEDMYPTFNEKFKIQFKKFDGSDYKLEKSICGATPGKP